MNLKDRSKNNGPLRITLLYLVFGCAWILMSDRILQGVVSDPELLGWIQSFKGTAFVLVTATALYFLSRTTEKPLWESRERFLRMVESMPIGILLLGGDMRLRYMNSELTRTIGLAENRDLGLDIREALPEELSEAVITLSERSLEQERSLSGEYDIALPEGNSLVLLLTSVPLGEDKGAVSEVLCIARDITESQTREREYKELLNGMHETVFIMDFQGSILEVNETAVRLLGYSREELLSMTPADFDPHLSPETIRELISGMAKDEKQFFETRHQTRDGVILPVEISSSRITYRGSSAIMSVVRDITERHKAKEALEESERRYRREKEYLDNLLDNSPDAISITDAKGRVIRWNRQTSQLLGFEFKEIEGEHFSSFYADPEEMEQMLSRLRVNKEVRGEEIRLLHKDGSAIPCSLSISLLSGEGGAQEGSIAIIRDLREWKLAQEKLEELSLRDYLTGLYNRAFFDEEMRRLADGRHCPLGLIVCDINGLKRINDALGHQKGDELIKTAADILRRCFRDSDIIARIGGDEFAVILPKGSEETLGLCCQRIAKEVEEHNAADPSLTLSIAIGHAVQNSPPVDTHELFQRADNAMYAQKQQHHLVSQG